MLDWGIPSVDQIMQMIHKPLLRVYANLTYVTNENVDDGFKVLLGFADDLNVHVEVGTSNFINLPRWYMQGENGTAIIRDWDCSGEIVMVSDWENPRCRADCHGSRPDQDHGAPYRGDHSQISVAAGGIRCA